MRAAVIARYGPPSSLRIVDLPPPEPGPGEVVLEVRAAAVTAADARLRGANFPRGFGPFARLGFGVLRPRKHVLGAACSGVVRSVGAGISDIVVGDRVCGQLDARMGAHAEQVLARPREIVPLPGGVSHEQAGMATTKPEAIGQLLTWAAEGRLRSVTDRVLPLDRIAQAHEVVDSGRKVGNLIIQP